LAAVIRNKSITCSISFFAAFITELYKFVRNKFSCNGAKTKRRIAHLRSYYFRLAFESKGNRLEKKTSRTPTLKERTMGGH
jgi:hypothetical protein